MKLGILTVLLAMLMACAEVQPWQREILARPTMATQPLILDTAHKQHLRQSREAGSTAGTAAGGGCGCY